MNIISTYTFLQYIWAILCFVCGCSFTLLSQSIPAWERINLPTQMSSGYFLDVQFLENDPKYGFICGFDGNILLTKDGGNSWSGVTIQGRPFLESIHFVDRLHGFVSGPGGVFKSIDGGLNWSEITNLNVNMSQIWGCYFVDKDNGLYIGGGCAGSPQVFVRTSNGGITWTTYRGFESESGLSDLILYDKNGLGFAVSSGLLWQTLDGGVTWKPMVNVPGPRAWAEEISNRKQSFLLPYAGDDCSGGGRTSGGANFTTDMGKTWQQYRGTVAMFGSYLINEQKGWICGDAGEVLYTSNAGDTWEKFNCGLNRANIDDMHFINDSLGWAVGEGVFRFTYKTIPDSFVIYPKAPFCYGDTITLTVPSEYQTIKWDRGLGSSPLLQVTSPGRYVVTAYNTTICRTLSDTVLIDFENPINASLSIKKDTVFCNDEIVPVLVEGIYSKVLWSDGNSDSLRLFSRDSQTINIYVDVFNGKGCRKRLYLPVLRWSNPDPPNVQVLGKSVLCNNDSTTLSADPGYVSYVWNDGQKGRTISVKSPGNYTVSVIDSLGCISQSLPLAISRIDLDNFLSSSFSGKKELEFDSTVIGNSTCVSLLFTNRNTMMDYELELPFIRRNIEFSIPMSQFPIRIKPGDSLSLEICFSPDSVGMWRDTIVFRDTCTALIFPLKGIGIPYIIEEESDCKVQLTTSFLTNGHRKLFEIRPNPLKDYMVIQSLDNHVNITGLVLCDVLGVKHSIHVSNSMSEYYVEIPELLNSGLYIPLIETSSGTLQLQPIIIVK